MGACGERATFWAFVSSVLEGQSRKKWKLLWLNAAGATLSVSHVLSLISEPSIGLHCTLSASCGTKQDAFWKGAWRPEVGSWLSLG